MWEYVISNAAKNLNSTIALFFPSKSYILFIL